MIAYSEAPREAVVECAVAWLDGDGLEVFSRFVDRWAMENGFGWDPDLSEERNDQEFMDFGSDVNALVAVLDRRKPRAEAGR